MVLVRSVALGVPEYHNHRNTVHQDGCNSPSFRFVIGGCNFTIISFVKTVQSHHHFVSACPNGCRFFHRASTLFRPISLRSDGLRLFIRALAAFRAISLRLLALRLLALAIPPLLAPSRPSATACGFFCGSWGVFSKKPS
jgi:hypothetical protein